MRKFYFTMLSFWIAGSSFGQSMTGSDLNANIGEVFNANQTNYVSPGSAGVGQTWDLSSMATTSSYNVSHSAANPGFPSTNITQTFSAGGAIMYYNFGSGGQVVHGVDANGVLITYSNPATQVGFPISVGVSGSDDHVATYNSGGFPFTRAGITSWEVDGSGTLITPNGTYTNVLRAFLVQDYSDTWTGPTVDYLVEIYAWFKAGIHYPIAEVLSLNSTIGGTTEYGYYLTGNVGLEEDTDLNFTLYPNPANTEITITQFNGNLNALVITDLNGKQVAQSDEFKIDISTLDPGLYFLLVIDKNGNKSEAQRFVKM